MAEARGRRYHLRVQPLAVEEAVVERIREVEEVPQIRLVSRGEAGVGAQRTSEWGSER